MEKQAAGWQTYPVPRLAPGCPPPGPSLHACTGVQGEGGAVAGIGPSTIFCSPPPPALAGLPERKKPA